MDKQPAVSLHRFHDTVGLAVLHGEGTVYLSYRDARRLYQALGRLCRSLEREKFGDSSGLNARIEAMPTAGDASQCIILRPDQ